MDLRESLEKDTVADIGYRAPVTLPEDASVREAVALMQAEKVGCLLVLDGERLAGIFTERDLLTRVLGEGKGLDGPLAEFMSSEPTVAREAEPIHRVFARMHAHGMRHLPVLNESGQPVGTLSVKRAVRFLTEHLPTTVYNLPPEPDQFPATREGG